MFYFIINDKTFKLPLGRLLDEEDVQIRIFNHALLAKNICLDLKEIEINKNLDKNGVKYLIFNSKTDFNKNRNDKLKQLAINDGLVDFNALIPIVKNVNIDELNYLQSANNYNQVYMNRIIDMDKRIVYSGCVIHSKGFMVGSRSVDRYNEHTDIIPFMHYRKIINYIKQLGKPIYVDKFMYGYPFRADLLNTDFEGKHNHTKISYVKPISNLPVQDRTALYNLYIKEGNKTTLPITEI